MTLYLHCFSASEPEFLRTKYSGFQFLTSRVLNYQTSADFIDHCYYFCTLGDFNKKSQTLFPFLSDGPHYIPFIHFLLSSLSLFSGVFFFHSPHYLSFLVFLPLSPLYMCEYSSACIYVSTCVCGRGREQDFWLEEEVREIEISEREGKKHREREAKHLLEQNMLFQSHR